MSNDNNFLPKLNFNFPIKRQFQFSRKAILFEIIFFVFNFFAKKLTQ